MAMQELGQIQEVNLRDIWPHEAHNFTTWLVQLDNLALLGSALGLDLEPVKPESPVGDFSLDILAREKSDGEMVAIENQLEQTDHGHLGQSLTYAAENRVGYVIWIASYFRPEHKKAIDWLNSLAPEKVWFFAVEIHAIQIGNSQPAADFRPVAVPADWSGGIGRAVIPSRPGASDSQDFREFFQPLIEELREAGFTDKAEAELECYQEFPSAVDDELTYRVSFEGDCAWVYLQWWGSKTGRDWSNKIYDALSAEKEEIEADIDEEWDWGNNRSTVGFTVSLWRYATINDPRPALAEIRAWMLETLPRFRDVFNPRLEKILAELDEA